MGEACFLSNTTSSVLGEVCPSRDKDGTPPREAGSGFEPINDSSLLLCVGPLKPWDPARFDTVSVLQQCPRNRGDVILVQDLQKGYKAAVKRIPVDWAGRDASEFFSAHPEETEVPWMDMGVTKWLNLQGYTNCVEYIGSFLDVTHVEFEMGYAEGGDLFSFMESLDLPGPSRASEEALRPLAVELLSSVRELHRLGISHRDLSLENVLLDQLKSRPLRLIDFGMATTVRSQDPGRARGKPSYIAPEVYLGSYDAFEADAFSCGVILYALTVRDYPWMATRSSSCKCFEYVRKHGLHAYMGKRKVQVGGVKKTAKEVISSELADLLAGMLALEPQKRLLLEEGERSIWAHPWLRGELLTTS